MLHKRIHPIVIAVFMFCRIGGAAADIEINIFLLNTEFLFDSEALNSSMVGESLPAPKAVQYEAKTKAIAGLIDTHQANIVGLVDVESRAVLEKVRSYLSNPDEWRIAFEEGWNTHTGQDVAILTTFRIAPGSVTNFPDEREVFFVEDEERNVNPSNILGVELRIASDPFYILISHLISRRNPANDPKRLAQANIVRRQAVKAMIQDKNVIVMGDMNDTPGTPVIKRLRGFDDIWGNLIQTANAVETDERYTYIYKDQKNLLYHILISPSLRNAFLHVEEGKWCEIIDVGELSDYRAIITRLRIAQPVVAMETDKGTIEIELYPKVAPKTVANFIKLVEQHFYDGLTFHRYEEGFVIQGGDPHGDGTGGPGWAIEGEFQNPKLRAKMPRHVKGVIAMARSNDPDSAGSQFYICLDEKPSRYTYLNGKYATFGRVISGIDVVDLIRARDKMNTVTMQGTSEE